MKVLVATAMYPSEARPSFGTFVRTQVESLERIGVDVHRYVLDGPSRKLMYLTAAGEIRRTVREAGAAAFDVVHAHYGLVGMVARLQRSAPLVVTFHGDDLLGTVDEHGRTTPTSKVIRAAGRRLARHADAVIVQNEQMAEVLERAPNVHVVPHEVDLRLFQPVDRAEARALLGLSPVDRYVLFAADPAIPVKRFPLAREAVEIVQRRYPRTTLLVIHDAPQERLALYMSACDALVFPSFQEGSPNVIKQAMACNLPIVATDVGDVRATIGRTAGCYVIGPHAASMADALRRILATRERTTGRSNIAHLSCERVAHRVVQVYDAAIARRAA